METVSFLDSKGNKLEGILSVPEHAKSVVVLSHGFTSSKNTKLFVELENELNKLGIGTLRYNYWGHGELYCKGLKYKVLKDVTLSNSVDSLRAAIKSVLRKGDYNIGLVGSSFGGLVSIIVASENSKIKALALKSPVTEPIKFWRDRLGDERIKKWKHDGVIYYNERSEEFELNYGFWEDLSNFNTFKMVENIKCPVFVVHGDNDTVVPIKQSQDFAKIVGTKVKIVKEANHAYSEPSQYAEMKKLIVDFIVINLK